MNINESLLVQDKQSEIWQDAADATCDEYKFFLRRIVEEPAQILRNDSPLQAARWNLCLVGRHSDNLTLICRFYHQESR